MTFGESFLVFDPVGVLVFRGGGPVSRRRRPGAKQLRILRRRGADERSVGCFPEWVYQLLQIQVGQWAQKVGDWHAECAQRLDGERDDLLVMPVLGKEGRRRGGSQVDEFRKLVGMSGGSRQPFITWTACSPG